MTSYNNSNIYLLLTEFEGRTVSYRSSFFLLYLWPKREAREPYIKGKKRGSVNYCTDRENEGSKIFIALDEVERKPNFVA